MMEHACDPISHPVLIISGKTNHRLNSELNVKMTAASRVEAKFLEVPMNSICVSYNTDKLKNSYCHRFL